MVNNVALPKSIRPLMIYGCYDHRNKISWDKLECHFAALKRSRQIVTWHSSNILPGDDFRYEVDTHIASADIVLLMISHYFFDSDLCWEAMCRAMQRHSTGDVQVVPILLSPVDYEDTPIASLQMLPRGKPITRWTNRDDAHLDVVRGIREVIGTFYRMLIEKGEVQVFDEFTSLLSEKKERFTMPPSDAANVGDVAREGLES